MAGYRKLGRTSSQRKALLRNQVTDLLYHGKIRTTEAKAKEIRKIAEGLIALGVREKDNFNEVTVTRTSKDGETIEKVVKKDTPSRLGSSCSRCKEKSQYKDCRSDRQALWRAC